MPAIITENWSDVPFVAKPPYEAVRTFVVSGLWNKFDASRATSRDLSIPQVNDPYPDYPTILCEGPIVTPKGPQTFAVQCKYSRPAKGLHFPQYDSALLQPPRMRWGHSIVTDQVDRDVWGNPLINSAGDPIANATRTFIFKEFAIWRYEPTYDLAKALYFENTVNDADITIHGVDFPAGSMWLTSIEPMEEYDAINYNYLPIQYQFQIISAVDWKGTPDRPWQWRFLDMGRRGWYLAANKATLGEIFDKPGMQVSFDVRLNGHGIPLDTDMTVQGNPPKALDKISGMQASIQSALIAQQFSNGDVALEDAGTGTFLRYDKYREVDFLQLGLGG